MHYWTQNEPPELGRPFLHGNDGFRDRSMTAAKSKSERDSRSSFATTKTDASLDSTASMAEVMPGRASVAALTPASSVTATSSHRRCAQAAPMALR